MTVTPRSGLVVLVATALLGASSNAAPVAPPPDLEIAAVSAPDINCVFDADCVVGPADYAGTFTIPGMSGEGKLQSRVWPAGEEGTRGVGLTAYLYRVDLTEMAGVGDIDCVRGVSVDFGEVAPLDYDDDGALEHVFVITGGGLGSVGLSRARQRGDAIDFELEPGVCPGASAGGGSSSFFFGLASEALPAPTQADVHPARASTLSVDARAPEGADDDTDASYCLPEFPDAPIPEWAPVCRCLRDRGAREFRCGFVHPDFFLVVRTPFPVEPPGPFAVRWTLIPTTELDAPVRISPSLPEGLEAAQGGGLSIDFPAGTTPLMPTTVERRLLVGDPAHELELEARLVYQGAGDRSVDRVLRFLLGVGLPRGDGGAGNPGDSR